MPPRLAPLQPPSRRALRSLFLLCVALFAGPGRATPADREALRRSIDALLAQAPLSSARVSAQVVSLDDGQVIYARGAEDTLNPASNTKLITSAAALLRLGPEYRFSTDVLADRAPQRGRVAALYVRGRGDPSINTERLQGLVADLAHRGLRQVGDLVLDDSYFDGQLWGPGWEMETSDKAFAAPVSALSLNHNSVGIYVGPGDGTSTRARIELEPEARGFFIVENRVQTVKAGARRRVIPHTVAEGEHTRVTVSGRIAQSGDPLILYRRVTDPTLYFGYTLRQLLQDRGIKVTGRVRRAATPESAALLASYESAELADIVRDMNKVSSNFIAEMLIKAMGAELRGVPGTWPKGLDVAQDLLAELGLPRGTYQLRNGSGLNDTNRFSAAQLSGLLVAVWKRFPVAAEFVSSLGIAARDGTLRLRMEGTDAAGRLRAKTGTLDKVTALSGYVQSLGGERFVFSILVNDWSGRTSPVISSIDRFGGMLASMGGPEPTAREAALLSLAAQAGSDASPAELKARVATYAALAQSADKKNLPFLRTALRSERDALVRAVVADALYRTDPEGGGGPLLEALPAAPELFVKLRALGQELALPLPLVPALLDLAAEGNAEALSRILALAPLARGAVHDDPLERALSEGLVDVGEAAPQETLSALRAAPPAQALAAFELIGLGLLQAGTDPQKFLLAQAVRDAAAQGGTDGVALLGWLALLEHRASPAADSAVAGGAAPSPASAMSPVAPSAASPSASPAAATSLPAPPAAALPAAAGAAPSAASAPLAVAAPSVTPALAAALVAPAEAAAAAAVPAALAPAAAGPAASADASSAGAAVDASGTTAGAASASRLPRRLPDPADPLAAATCSMTSTAPCTSAPAPASSAAAEAPPASLSMSGASLAPVQSSGAAEPLPAATPAVAASAAPVKSAKKLRRARNKRVPTARAAAGAEPAPPEGG